MGEEIVIELPDSEDNETSPVADLIIADELISLREAEAERTAADIMAAALLAQSAHDHASEAHTRIDEIIASQAIEAVTEIALEAIAETQIEPEPEIIEPEMEPEHEEYEQHEDKKPQREHWFFR